MSKVVTVIREYDDDGHLTCETRTTEVEKKPAPEERRPIGFVLPERRTR